MDDCGEINLLQIKDGDEFWCIMDELYDDSSEFVHNRTLILEAYRRRNLFGLSVTKTDKMHETRDEKRASQDGIFCKGSGYLLPCFCVKDRDRAILIWTHTRARNNGFAKRMVQMLDIVSAYHPVPESAGFWKKCGIPYP